MVRAAPCLCLTLLPREIARFICPKATRLCGSNRQVSPPRRYPERVLYEVRSFLNAFLHRDCPANLKARMDRIGLPTKRVTAVRSATELHSQREKPPNLTTIAGDALYKLTFL